MEWELNTKTTTIITGFLVKSSSGHVFKKRVMDGGGGGRVCRFLQLGSHVERLELLYPLDEVGLLQAAVATLVPPAQDLLKVLHLK